MAFLPMPIHIYNPSIELFKMFNRHRPSTSLHQSNKKFKTRHASKSELKKADGGKVQRTVTLERSATRRSKMSADNASLDKVKLSRNSARDNRKNTLKITQAQKRMESLAVHRMFTGKCGVPKIVAVIPLCRDIDVTKCISTVLEVDSNVNTSDRHPVMEFAKQKLEFVELQRPAAKQSQFNHFMDILDAVKVADYAWFILSAEEPVDQLGIDLLTAIRAQGLPTPVCSIQHLDQVATKKHNDVKKSLSSFMFQEISVECKMFNLDHSSDVHNFARTLTEQRPNTIHWRGERPYMLVDLMDYNAEERSLKVSGTARGLHFHVDRLIHIQTFGDFQLQSITTDNGTLLPTEDQQLLEFEQTPDPMAGEQTWPTEEEIMDAEERVRQIEAEENKHMRRVPKGTSNYQAAWIIDEEDTEDVERAENEMALDNDEVDSDGEVQEFESVDMEGRVDDSTLSDDDDNDVDNEEEEEHLAQYLNNKKKTVEEELSEELEFPDEKDVPMDSPARVRFQRYRGLKSFGKAEWDVYENLPLNYSRIVQFDNFERTRNRVKREIENETSEEPIVDDNGMEIEGESSSACAPAHSKLTLIIRDVPPAAVEMYSTENIRPFVLFGLLPHEQKMSVCNMSVTRPKSFRTLEDKNDEFKEPVIRSKDPVMISCGFRRFINQPVYSQNTRGHLHKVEKFFFAGSTVFATMYAPIMFPPASVIMFMPPKACDTQSWPKLLATGTLESADPNRMLIKRIILTGTPTRIHKSSRHSHSAVVRFMFFNDADIQYFKPIELKTKFGRRGHIIDSIGTHGAMKCRFDKTLQGMDTICMHLYKRVFPKWPGYHGLFGEEAAKLMLPSSNSDDMKE